MGFRIPYVYVNADGNSGGAILDLNGPKYLILVIDDYNQNHVNNSLVSISQFSNTLKMPFYYSDIIIIGSTLLRVAECFLLRRKIRK
jgi:hypothetical protein